MKDPLRSDNPLVVVLYKKCDILVCNLLQNFVEAGDIFLETPAIPTCSLPFPDITMAQIEKAVLYIGNIISRFNKLPTSILKMAWPLIKDRVFILY
jgi:hypothetical protein